jgi:chemotaxis protein CheX
MIDSARVVQAIQAATEEVFVTMLDMTADVLEPSGSPGEDDDPNGSLVAMVGLTGAWSGTGSVVCPPSLAQEVWSRMFMAEPSGDSFSLSDEVLDAVAELANMIIGNTKNSLEEDLGSLAMSIPSVIYGRNFRIRSLNGAQWVVVPFSAGGNRITVKICLAPTPACDSSQGHRMTNVALGAG